MEASQGTWSELFERCLRVHCTSTNLARAPAVATVTVLKFKLCRYLCRTCPANGIGEDPYSTVCWTPDDRCGNYRQEGDCFNREHSLPKSWWGKDSKSKAYSDLYVSPTHCVSH